MQCNFSTMDWTMDREQALAIAKHLMDADAFMARAAEIMFGLEPKDRAIFAASLHAIDSAFDDLFEGIYGKFPDMRPPSQEVPEISSLLRWEDVVLPESVSEADLDRIIFSKMGKRLQKTAMIVGRAFMACKRLELPVTSEILGARIEALAASDRIDSEGDLRYWRHSEIRLKPDDPN
jgi:Protein of unknown function